MSGVHNKPSRQRGSLSGPLPESVLINGEYVAFNVGQFLGKGSFANVYKFVSPQLTAAGKVISKHMLKEKHKCDMIRNEIGIHNKLHHEHIVEMYASWNDDSNIYMLLELCTSRSLFELHLARHAISEAETRYFMRQTISAIGYLHDKLIVHRDIKLGNLLINDQMKVKLADFGMAVQLRNPYNILQQFCGTPNYIAPEILFQSGYSFPVDVWSLGVCCYTLMVGVPPFETKSVKATYMQIKSGHYTVPAHVSSSARFVISELLQANPSSRPMAKCIEKYPWFNEGFTPREFPSTCCVVSPCINQNSDYGTAAKMDAGDVRTQFGKCANRNVKTYQPTSQLIEDKSVMRSFVDEKNALPLSYLMQI
ncbi:Polo-like kinase [Aphelenchoides besseyi]|nr:Polo-like kinase [Aphelenchoides besseyi]KAI6210956.1 Polo-like kinase [Aphelenchoides besseyi]